MTKLKIKLRDWMVRNADSPHAKWWLLFISFAEASFFPIPPDFLLIAILGSRQKHRWAYYSFIVTVGSVLGGMFGFVIGFLLFDSIGQFIISVYSLEHYMEVVQDLFAENAFWAIFIAGFTPIPYKIFTISAGFFGVNFLIFIIASAVSRLLRFFAVGYIIKVFGDDMSKFAFKYFNILTLLFAIGVIIFIVTFNIF